MLVTGVARVEPCLRGRLVQLDRGPAGEPMPLRHQEILRLLEEKVLLELVGALLGGRYRVTALIGRGGMGCAVSPPS
ncbi:hypothetical protein ACFWMX_35445 [Streptomyces sp. NPDC058378]|uniref:hypothetical protein n=1 Tax=unclassified Streptomyces TaxID=2593676 RepID=UPI00365639E6